MYIRKHMKMNIPKYDAKYIKYKKTETASNAGEDSIKDDEICSLL